MGEARSDEVADFTQWAGRTLTTTRSRLRSSLRSARVLFDESVGLSSRCHGITADVEVIPSAQVQTALDRLARNDVRYRFSLDMSDLQTDPLMARIR